MHDFFRNRFFLLLVYIYLLWIINFTTPRYSWHRARKMIICLLSIITKYARDMWIKFRHTSQSLKRIKDLPCIFRIQSIQWILNKYFITGIQIDRIVFLRIHMQHYKINIRNNIILEHFLFSSGLWKTIHSGL